MPCIYNESLQKSPHSSPSWQVIGTGIHQEYFEGHCSYRMKLTSETHILPSFPLFKSGSPTTSSGQSWKRTEQKRLMILSKTTSQDIVSGIQDSSSSTQQRERWQVITIIIVNDNDNYCHYHHYYILSSLSLLLLSLLLLLLSLFFKDIDSVTYL